MQCRIVTRYPKITTSCPGVIESVATAQDPTLPGGTGTLYLDYAATPSSKLAFKAPGSVIGAYSADLDTGDPTGTVLTDGQSHFIAVDVTSATLAAVVVDTEYGVVIVPSGTALWTENDVASVAASVERGVQAGVCFDRADFSGLDLSGCDLRGMRAKRASFKGCRLIGTRFNSADLSYCDFTGAMMAGANFTSATLTAADFTGTERAEAVFTSATTTSADFEQVAASADGTVVPIAPITVEWVTSGSGTAITRTLPAAAVCPGILFLFVKVDTGTTAAKVAPPASTIDGASYLSLAKQYDVAMVMSDGTSFHVVPRQPTATSAANAVPQADANGKLAAGWGGSASTLATLDSGSKVVENPANATATPTAAKIPIAGTAGDLSLWGYTAGDATDWATAAPATIAAALDRIASALKDHLASTIP